jgi:hypothetical protein
MLLPAQVLGSNLNSVPVGEDDQSGAENDLHPPPLIGY